VSEIPIIELFGHLLVPLQGDIGDRQAESLRERVLARLRNEDCESVILDTSGVWVLDSHLCSVLALLAGSAQLMGVRSVLCGMKPEMVMTLQAMGIELTSVSTAINLEDALHKLGYALVKQNTAVPAATPKRKEEREPVKEALDTGMVDLHAVAALAKKRPLAPR
jgi:rsbT antagonist protein RsbS